MQASSILSVFLVTLALVACSGAPKPIEPERQWNTNDVNAEEDDVNAEEQADNAVSTIPDTPVSVPEACDRYRTLRSEGCAWTTRFPAEFAEGQACEKSLASWVDADAPNREVSELTLRCWSLACDAAIPCIREAQSSRAPDKPRVCGEKGNAPIVVDDATWQARRGKDTKRFAEVSTTVEEPVEVCDIAGEMEWMTKVTCNDGSNPYASRTEVNEKRDGWLGNGGRCNSVLDRYTVPCPEATYTIHVDRYVCPASP